MFRKFVPVKTIAAKNVYSLCIFTGTPPTNPHFPHDYPQKMWVKPLIKRGFEKLSTEMDQMHKNFPQTQVCIGHIAFIIAPTM